MKTDRRYWVFSISWILLIYSTLYVVRPICNFLKRNTEFEFLILIGLLSVFIGIVIVFRKRLLEKQLSSKALFILVIILYAISLRYIEYPEEKIHLVEYGFLSYLFLKALKPSLKGVLLYIAAFLLTSIVGWIDEGIQYLLPNRYYQATDVLLNIISGGFGLLLTFSLERK
ncbi:MAG: VanZ family protein [Candidatus Omnitrophota bacterium]